MLYDTVIDNTNLPERDTIGIYEKLEKLSYGNGMLHVLSDWKRTPLVFVNNFRLHDDEVN